MQECPTEIHTVILATIPSSCASTSICALSVSISNKTSPVEKVSPFTQFNQLVGNLQSTYSPSLTFQLAMLPSVIVGDMAGMVKF